MSFINEGQGIAAIRKKFLFEWKLFNHIVVTFILLIIFQAVFLFYQNNTVFSKEFLLDFYLTLSVVLVSGAVWHLKSYGKDIKSPHLGMMTGMTLGMQTGMMIGIILGATDGFFVGALITMVIAASIGAMGGSCSGIAGILEGLMAGSMGGIMGAMTGAMLLDDLLWFMPPFMILNFIIMFGLIYMIYREVTENRGILHISPTRFSRFFLFNLLALTLLTLALHLAQHFPGNHSGMIH